MPSNRYSYPMSNQAQKDHILRYSQRIADIFENSEEELDVESPKHNANKKSSNLSYVPRTSYKSIIDDVKAIEAKYKKMNEDVEEKRTKTELDYLRPSKKTFALPTEFTPLSKVQAESKSSTRTYSQFDNIENRRPTMSEKTIQLFRDASTPCPGLHTASSKQTTRNPARYLAANLRTDIYNRSRINESLNTPTYDLKVESTIPLPKSEPILPCGLKRRYTNRETRIARQTLEYIQKGERWTSTVERPFIVGI